MQRFAEEDILIGIISEAPIRRDSYTGRWLTSCSGMAAIIWTHRWPFGCTVFRRGRDYVAARMGNLLVVSCYISPRSDRKRYLTFFDELGDLIGAVAGTDFIIACDFNARSPTWNLRFTNNYKGTLLEEWAAERELRLLNDGRLPTCVNPSVVDLTCVTPNLVKHVVGWRVTADDVTLSDHNYIWFNVNDSTLVTEDTLCGRVRLGEEHSRWNYSKLDDEMLLAALEWYGGQGDNVSADANVRSAEESVRWIDHSVKSACDMAAPRVRKPIYRRNTYWWNPRIAELCRLCIRAKRLLTRHNSHRRHCNLGIIEDLGTDNG